MKKYSLETMVVIVAVMVVVIPLGIFSVISVYSSSNALTEIIKKELEDKSAITSYAINAFIDERIIDARTISQADVLEAGNSRLQSSYLTEIVKENKWIEDIDVLNLEGRVTASSGSKNEDGQLFWERQAGYKELYLSAIKAKQGQVYVSEATALDSGPGFFLITPITDDTNNILIGLLAIEVNLNDMAKIIFNYNQRPEDKKHIYIVDDDGRVIISDDPLVKFLDSFPDLQVQPKLLRFFSDQGSIGNTVYIDNSKHSVMAGYADMAEFGENKALDWNVVTIVPVDKITQPVSELKYILLLLGFIITVISAAISYRISLFYTNNLEKIASRAENISKGEHSEGPSIVANRKGAFNTLVTAFNRMESNIKQVISDLKDREQRLNITLDSIGDGVIVTDEKGNITRMNPTAEKITGWNYNDVSGRSIKSMFSIVDETSREPIKNPIDKVIETGETVYLSNHTILISKSGKEFHIEDSAAPIKDENNNILGMILIFNDVTRRKIVEKQYRRAQKMDALGKLTGGVAHDYNNMLGVIIGYCELAKDSASNQPNLLRYISVIKDSANRGANLTKKLLDFSRNKPSKTDVFSFNDLLENQRFMLEKTLTVRIELVLDLTDNAWSVYLDENDAIDCILNIGINAMHAIKDNGRITISTSNEKINETKALSLGIAVGDYVLLSFTDTGCGMDKNTLSKIFEPFFSTKGESGTGLGLSQAYGFIQRSKGAIKVHSDLGYGTRFELYFPRHYIVDEQKEEDDNNKLIDLNIIGTETILVVDDEPALVKFCCKVLEKKGFKALPSDSVKNALEILETEKVDLLLTDIIMPDIDGYQLASIVKEKYPQIRIQLVSGYANDNNKTALDEKIQQNLLPKPYTQQELLVAINSCLK